MNDKDEFVWDDKLVMQFANYLQDNRQEGAQFIQPIIDQFKASKQKPKRIIVGLMDNLHRNACDDFYQIKICTSHEIPEAKFPAIKQSIERVLNNDGYYDLREISKQTLQYTHAQLEEAERDAYTAGWIARDNNKNRLLRHDLQDYLKYKEP